MGKTADELKDRLKTETKEIRKLSKAMEESLEPKRYYHTLGVSFTAAALAMRYGMNMREAQIAGLLHDCAKCLSDEKLISICEKNGLNISPVERRNPYLLHGKVGAFIAQKEYSVDNPDILNAICYHTTGRPHMSELEKIIFIADYIEPGRYQAENLELIRKMAFEDLNNTMIKILSDTLDYLQKGKGEIDPMTKSTYEFFVE